MIQDLKQKIVDCLIEETPTGVRFQPRGLQRQPDLLNQTATELLKKMQTLGSPKPDAIVALGTSGVALGVAASRLAKLPLYFYKMDGWPFEADYQIPYLLPKNEGIKNVVLIDSHYRSGFSLLRVANYLQRRLDLETTAIGVVFAPDGDFLDQHIRSKLVSCLKLPEDAMLLESKLNTKKLQGVLSADSVFWGFKDILPIDPKPLEVKKREVPPIEELSSLEKSFERIASIPITDPEIWRTFLQPEAISEIAEKINAALDVSTKYTALVGISVLGTALATYISLTSQQPIKIFSTQFTENLAPRVHSNELSAERVLICNTRLTSGIPVSNALALLNKEGVQVADLFVLKVDFSILPSRRRTALKAAAHRGLQHIYTASYKS